MSFERYDVNDEVYLTWSATDEDIPALVKYLNNPALTANTLRIPSPYTDQDGKEFIEKVNTSSKDDTQILIIRCAKTNELIGACGFHRSPANDRRTEIGYWIGQPFWHRGLMPQIVKTAIPIVKQFWKNLVRIEANVFIWNKPSTRVLEKSGFQLEGIRRKFSRKNGEDVDEYLYSLIF